MFIPFLLNAALLPMAQTATDASEPITLLVNYLTPPSQSEVEWYESELGATVKYRYSIIPTLAIVTDSSKIETISTREGVDFVEMDSDWQVSDIDNTWGVDYIGGRYTLAQGLMGTGIKMGVIDTGIDYNHPELAARYMGGWDFVNNDNDPADDNFHGTHVSGTIAAAMDGTGVVGVAPNVELYAIKGFNAGGSGQTSDLIACVDWTTVNDMDVVNNSWGGGGSPTLEAVFQASRDAGVIHVCAAGNNFGLFGVSPPAKYSSTYAISAIDNLGKPASFSDRGPEVDFAAPGVDVLSANLGGGYTVASGTSMASPHVAGATAIVLAHSGLVDLDGDGTLFEEARDRMAATALDLGDEGKDNRYGHGVINVQGAVDAPMMLSSSVLTAGAQGALQNDGGTAGDMVAFLYSNGGGGRTDVPAASALIGLRYPILMATVTADAAGSARLTFMVPASLSGTTVWAQAVEGSSNTSNTLKITIN